MRKAYQQPRLAKSFPGSSDSKESACNAGDPDSIPGSGSYPGEGNGNPLQYSHLENPMEGGAWQAWRVTVHGVTKSYMTQWLTLSLSWRQTVNQVVHKYKWKALEGNERGCTSEHTNDESAKQPYCWYGESLSGLDRKSNQPPHSRKPKPDLEKGPNSFQFWEGWEGQGGCTRKVWS